LTLLHSIPVSLLVLGLFTYWYAVADRYQVFLYGHLGATPFDDVTRSRYWMSGLVAGGAILVLYSSANWVLGRGVSLSRPRLGSTTDELTPTWWRVWLLCALPLAIGICVITMTRNSPVLPATSAAACVASTLLALALALPPGAWAARRPSDLLWLAFDGAGLMPALLLLRALELPRRGLVSAPVAYAAALGTTLAGVAWLGVMTRLRRWRRKPAPGAAPLVVSGLCLSYLLLPLAHHLVATPPGYRYISTASNFFAFSPWLQLCSLLLAALLAIGITRLRSSGSPSRDATLS
jgi:hypothetical protein